MRKLRTERGETLVESLCAILVITIVFVFLCGAIVSAARSNKQVRDSDQSFSYKDMEATGDLTIQVSDGTASRNYTVTGYGAKANPEGSLYSQYPYRRYEMKGAGN